MPENIDSVEIRFNNRQLIPFLTALALFLGLFMGGFLMYIFVIITDDNTPRNSSNNLPTLRSSSYYDQDFIESVVDILNERYLGETDEITSDDVTYGMVKGLIESLNDQYTNYFTPEEAEQYFEQAAGDFEGVGISLSFNGLYTYVETVLKGQPAEAAGIQPGDLILSVDGEDVEDKLPAFVASRIRGEKGTEVVLGIYRAAENASQQEEEIEITITRDRIEVDNVSWEKHDDNTAIIDIVQFSDASAQDFNRSWDKVKSEIEAQMPGLENIIVDLRGNPGGYVFSVRYVLEDFLEEGQIIMKERTKSLREDVYTDERDGPFEDERIIVLVNEGSASASEIFAGAIQDHERGVVVGERTVGKGVEQEMITLPDGSLLLLVFQEWLTPDGRVVRPDEPIIPDHEVEYTLDNFKNNTDPQLDKALELISN